MSSVAASYIRCLLIEWFLENVHMLIGMDAYIRSFHGYGE